MPKKMSARIRWITRSQWIAEKNWPVGAPCRGRGEWFCTTDPLDSNNKIKKIKCFILCRLGTRKPFFLSLSCLLGPAVRKTS